MKIIRNFFALLVLFFVTVHSANIIFAQSNDVPDKKTDTASVTGDSVLIDKKKNTLLLKDNVIAIRNSTKSSLKTEKLFLQKDETGANVIQAEANKNIVIVDQGVTLKADWAHFDRKTNLIKLRGNIEISSVEFSLTGDYFEYDYQNGKGRITEQADKKVNATFWKTRERKIDAAHVGALDSTADQTTDLQVVEVAECSESSDKDDESEEELCEFVKAPIVGEAQEILIDRPSQKVTFNGFVKIVDKFEETRFEAERAVVFLDSEEQIEEIVASDNFLLEQPGRFSRADKAIISYLSETITLIGNAVVKGENEMEITSEQIEMFMEVSKGIIKGGKHIPVRINIPIN